MTNDILRYILGVIETPSGLEMFGKGFRHKEVTSQYYMQKLIVYIHRNPNHHGYGVDYTEYG